MGDLPTKGAIGIVCLECGTHWRDKDAFDRNDPDPEVIPEIDDDASDEAPAEEGSSAP